MYRRIKKTIKMIDSSGQLYYSLRSYYLRIKNLFTPNGYFRNYILFPICGFFRIHHMLWFDKKCKEIEKYKDIHRGERCFVIATGPSMTIEDLNLLKNEFTISMNRIFYIYDKTEFRPTYYVGLEPQLAQFFFDTVGLTTMKHLAKDAVFLNSANKRKEEGIIYLPYCHLDHWFRCGDPKFDASKSLKYSTDLVWGLYDKYSCTPAAIEIAAYMGFEQIILVGVDCDYVAPKKQFFENEIIEYPKETIRVFEKQNEDMIIGYRFLETEMTKRGITVLNATRGGRLEEFKRVDLDKIIKENVHSFSPSRNSYEQ